MHVIIDSIFLFSKFKLSHFSQQQYSQNDNRLCEFSREHYLCPECHPDGLTDHGQPHLLIWRDTAYAVLCYVQKCKARGGDEVISF